MTFLEGSQRAQANTEQRKSLTVKAKYIFTCCLRNHVRVMLFNYSPIGTLLGWQDCVKNKHKTEEAKALLVLSMSLYFCLSLSQRSLEKGAIHFIWGENRPQYKNTGKR